MTTKLFPCAFEGKEKELLLNSKLGKETEKRSEHIKMCYNRMRAFLVQNNRIDFNFN